MDLQTGLTCIFVAICLTVVIYLFFSVKGNTFDEDRASRRKLLKQHIAETKISNEKAKEKKSKKAKKAKDKEREVGKQILPHLRKDSDTQSVEDEGEREQIDEKVKLKEDVHIDRKPVNETKGSKSLTQVPDSSKSNEQIGVTHPENKPENKPEKKEQKKKPLPVNQVRDVAKKKPEKPSGKVSGEEALSQSGDSAEGTAKTDINQKPLMEVRPTTMNGELIEDVALSKSSTILENARSKDASPIPKEIRASITPKVNKKKKSDVASLHVLNNDKDGVNINLFMRLLEKAELSRSEIQLLIDSLLNMQQQESSEWLKSRQDPLVKLKKQLAEKEKALQEEHHSSLGLQAKLKELRLELNSLKSAHRRMEETYTLKTNEIHALNLKFQKVSEENQALLNKTQQLQKQLNDEIMLASKLKEEQMVQSKIHLHDQHHEAMMSLNARANQLASQLQEQQGINTTLTGENVSLQERLTIQEEYNADLKRHVTNTQFEAKRLQEQVSENRREIENMSSLIQGLQAENQSLREEADCLSKQMNASVQEPRCMVEVNECPVQAQKENRENGDLSYSHEHDHAQISAIIEEKDLLLNKLHLELTEKDRLLEKLNAEVVSCKNEANLRQTMLDNASLELNKVRTQTGLLLSDISKKESAIRKLNEDISEKNAEITPLKNEIETLKQRNNELRNKNWKVVEALGHAEQALQKSSPPNVPSTQDKNVGVMKIKSQVGTLLQRLFPDISIEDTEDVDTWLKKLERFAEAAEKSNINVADASSDMDTRNRQLQALVNHYQAIINDTEEMLNGLQTHIEVEETKWRKEIQTLQAELDSLRDCKNLKEK